MNWTTNLQPSTPREDEMSLLKGIAKTAVVAGTSQAVRGRVARRQSEKFADRDQSIAATRGEGWARGTRSAHATAPSPTTAATDPVIAKLRQLAELRDQGVLTDEEFAAQKSRILGQAS